ncbi:MAG: hypothetical protein MUC99_09810 [Anaerolineae bacterium]|jgi:hypothetical protein|nr:hypothetical protein [Anaerolineae bacterium]
MYRTQRSILYRLIGAALVLLTAALGLVSAQSSGGRETPINPDQPLPFPTDGQGWLALSESEFFALMQRPEALSEFASVGLPTFIEELRDSFMSEFSLEWENFSTDLQTAYDTTLTRLLMIALGALLLIWPHRLHYVTWLLVGAVVGALVAQTGALETLMANAFPDEAALQSGVLGVVVGFALVGLFASLVGSIVFFSAMTFSGWLAGGLLGASQLNGGIFDLGQPTVLVPAIVMGILMAYAAGRSGRLIAIVVGAGLVVLALRWQPAAAVPILIVSFLAMMLRTNWRKSFKRQPLNQLNLREGEVALEGQNRPTQSGRKAQTVSDDSDNSPIGRFS